MQRFSDEIFDVLTSEYKFVFYTIASLTPKISKF